MNELSEKAVNNVKEYIATETTKQQSSDDNNKQQFANRRKTIGNVMVAMLTATHQLIQMKVMEQAPVNQHNRFFGIMHEKSIIDAKLVLFLSLEEEEE